RSLEEAVSWYRDDLLPDDANEPWTVVERERLRLSHLSALERLADGRSQQGRFAEATETLRTLLRAEPWREAAYRQMMKALTAMGRRAEALYLYRQCEALLQRELGVRPSPETIALFERIAGGHPV
ncbi:MAG: AfsR/SARP family transcriptional regulator, partial [bacterium]